MLPFAEREIDANEAIIVMGKSTIDQFFPSKIGMSEEI